MVTIYENRFVKIKYTGRVIYTIKFSLYRPIIHYIYCIDQ